MRIQNEELATLIILALSLAAIGALFLLTGASTHYSYDSPNGTRVTVSGPVLSKENTYQGGHIVLSVKTDAGPLDVFVPAASDAYEAANRTKPGSEIEATGLVQTFKGQKEVVAEKIKPL
ncbi:MAG TPA: OB-fold nucleic acid binding domain-containing protein [Methanocella sp.]|uniref:OB-fold nucleic acid binding domain-containing protein n=1 Tax=Methanocella sp. TaxID=2052833 RepID=UPI002CD2E2CB|nr:OB-fold nucleic acid binding domain-containing protein [Methanocella sp.]HTY91482.1 OB-fold nucleic acid binding domain-containing protein [Methanocella sp.]